MKRYLYKVNVNYKFGFTLMEIMVVIIVIAVLASVAGPMISSITDQGKMSATKAAMGNIKSALVNYSSDLSRFPHVGSVYNEANIDAADNVCMSNAFNSNVLVNENVAGTFNYLNLGNTVYLRKWKGPYMDSSPEIFMMDSWGRKIRYFYEDKQLWLQSSGIDGEFDKPYSNSSAENAASTGYNGDDILISVASRLRLK